MAAAAATIRRVARVQPCAAAAAANKAGEASIEGDAAQTQSAEAMALLLRRAKIDGQRRARKIGAAQRPAKEEDDEEMEEAGSKRQQRADTTALVVGSGAAIGAPNSHTHTHTASRRNEVESDLASIAADASVCARHKRAHKSEMCLPVFV